LGSELSHRYELEKAAHNRAIVQQVAHWKGRVVATFYDKGPDLMAIRAPQLKRAIAACEQHAAELLLTRVTRSGIPSSRVFYRIDLRHHSIKVEGHAALALFDTAWQLSGRPEADRKEVRERTIDALKPLKNMRRSDGSNVLGNPNLLATAIPAATEGRVRKADEFAKRHYTMIRALLEKKYTFAQIAESLNRNDVQTSQGKFNAWYAGTVRTLVKRVKKRKLDE
jgi:hypothetical protein